MPLLDHFHPPLSQRRHWENLHSAWANAIRQQLNDVLPSRYFAEVTVHLGSRVEVDVATFEEEGSETWTGEGGGVAVWAPPRPTRTVPLNFSDPDIFEVQVYNDETGPRVVAAIELISPANKDRPAHRHTFAVKCASYLQAGISLVQVDVVTDRSGNLHDELLRLMDVVPEPSTSDLYAGAYRTASTREAIQLEYWLEPLAVGSPLPLLPLWISPDRCLPLNLEQAYGAACASSRIVQ